jgi:hypothetical protein
MFDEAYVAIVTPENVDRFIREAASGLNASQAVVLASYNSIRKARERGDKNCVKCKAPYPSPKDGPPAICVYMRMPLDEEAPTYAFGLCEDCGNGEPMEAARIIDPSLHDPKPAPRIINHACDFDMKRRIVDPHEVNGALTFNTAPWRDVDEFMAAVVPYEAWKATGRSLNTMRDYLDLVAWTKAYREGA